MTSPRDREAAIVNFAARIRQEAHASGYAEGVRDAAKVLEDWNCGCDVKKRINMDLAIQRIRAITTGVKDV